MGFLKQIATIALILLTVVTLYSSAYYKANSDNEAYSTSNLSEEIETVNEQVLEETVKLGYIFIGDSRFVGMNNKCKISNESDRFVIASVSEGYRYLIETAIPETISIMESNTEVTDWKVIICLGINDLHNIDKYIETYNTIKDNIDLVIVSVNPVAYHSTISNEAIEEFNSKLKDIEGVQYIDTYSDLVDYGFGTVDGIHYTNDTYEYIYLTIGKNLKY